MAERMSADGLPEPSMLNGKPNNAGLRNRLPPAVSSLLARPFKFLFGNDIFISYSRADGINYAEGLASQLAKRNFSCSLDLWETTPGKEMPAKLKRAVRWSKMLVIIGTGAAAGSPNCELEIVEFARTKGTIIPIDFNHAVDGARWFPTIQGLPIAREANVDALVSGRPSEGIISRIEHSVKFTRRNRRAQRIFILSLAAFGVLIILSLLAGRSANAARSDANRARAEAENQIKLAADAKNDADVQRQLAQAASDEKDKQKKLAAEAKIDADKQRGLAETANTQREIAEHKTEDAVKREQVASRNAAEQQQIAYSRQLAGHSATEMKDNPELGLLLSAHSYDTYPTFESRRSLMTGLLTYPHLETIVRHSRFPVGALAISPDGSTMASASADGAIVFWDVQSHEQLGCPVNLPEKVEGPQREDVDDGSVFGVKVVIPSVNFSPSGKLLAAACSNFTICFWDVTTREKISEINVAQVLNLAFVGNDRLAMMGENTINFLDITNVKRPRQLEPLEVGGNLFAMAFSADGRTMAVNSNREIRLYDLISRKMLPEPLLGHDGMVVSLAFSPKKESNILLSVDEKGKTLLWDTATRKSITLQRESAAEAGSGDESDKIAGYSFNADGSRLAMSRVNGTIITLDLTNPPDSLNTRSVSVYKEGVTGFVFANKDKSLVLGNFDGTLAFWNLSTLPPLGQTFPRPKLDKGPANSEELTLSENGEMMASGDGNGDVFLWRVNTDQPLQVLPHLHKTYVDHLALSSDGKKLATSDFDQNIFLWDTTEKRFAGKESLPPVRDEKGNDTRRMVSFLAFNPHDSEMLVSGRSDGSVTLWNIKDPQKFQEIVTYHQVNPSKVAFSRDGKRLATGGFDGPILLWDLSKAKPTAHPLEGTEGEAMSLQFTPDGQSLISVSADSQKSEGAVFVWNLGGSRVPPRRFNLGSVEKFSQVNISPDGSLLTIIPQTSRVVALWDIAAHSLVGQFQLDNYNKFSTFSSDGKRLISISFDNMTVTDVSPDLWISRACRLAHRTLTAAERSKFLDNRVDHLICEETVAPNNKKCN